MQVQDKTRAGRETAILALVCAVLQLALAPNIGLGNGRANFALVFTLSLSLYQNVPNPTVAGFLAGLLFDLSSTGPVGLMAFCLTAAAFVLSSVWKDTVANDPAGASFVAAGACLAVSLAYHLAMLLVGQADSLIDVVVFRTLPTALLSFVAYLPFAYYYRRVHATGPTLGSGRKGGHFSTKGL